MGIQLKKIINIYSFYINKNKYKEREIQHMKHIDSVIVSDISVYIYNIEHSSI